MDRVSYSTTTDIPNCNEYVTNKDREHLQPLIDLTFPAACGLMPINSEDGRHFVASVKHDIGQHNHNKVGVPNLHLMSNTRRHILSDIALRNNTVIEFGDGRLYEGTEIGYDFGGKINNLLARARVMIGHFTKTNFVYDCVDHPVPVESYDTSPGEPDDFMSFSVALLGGSGHVDFRRVIVYKSDAKQLKANSKICLDTFKSKMHLVPAHRQLQQSYMDAFPIIIEIGKRFDEAMTAMINDYE